MEKSIESIWKEGFLKSDALIAPKLNDLYNQKSTHLVDKYKRMFKINLIAVFIGSIIILGISFISGIPVMGIGVFFILNAIVIVNRKLLPGLEKIDKNTNSYEYLKTFDNWMKEKFAVNARMASYYYPLFFISIVLGFWFSFDFQETINEILGYNHEIYLVYGIPIYWLIPIVIITGLLAVFGGRIYYWDLHIVYGHVLKKLEEMIADMEELRE